MLTNYHTHTTLCDGKNTPEEMVITAIEKGFSALGFSGHAVTDFDRGYCLQDINGYLTEIHRLKQAYHKEIQIYTGIEEDAFQWADRNPFDYLLGSSHYVKKDGIYYALDSGAEKLQAALDAFGGDTLLLAETYFSNFCNYIKKRKPDIVGHFDILTKYEETKTHCFLSDPAYHNIAEKYLKIAAQNDVIFEVNTGGIARGIRTNPYPYENLLHILKKEDAKLMLNSDSHRKDTLDCHFSEMRNFLKEIGFSALYIFYNNQFQKDFL